ncbi:respiratory nitrate reductase subunit gamma [Sulfolobus sp. S-194]
MLYCSIYRLVHVFTFPITYLWRPYIIYKGYRYARVIRKKRLF